MNKKPHIIIFNPDEMRWDTMRHMGNPAAVTPYLDDFAKNEAISYAKEQGKEHPLCLFLGLMYPHVPYMVEEPYYSGISREKLPKRIKLEDCVGKSSMIHALSKYEQMDHYTEEEWDELRVVYLGMCSKVDVMFKRLCDGLKEAGIYDDCAIFFLSDHGDFAGDYGLTEKAQSTFEDCLTRVPLLIKPPKGEKVDPGITDSMTELVDFYRTAMDYAGVELKRNQFGISLRPVIEDRKYEIRTYSYSEGGRNANEPQCDEYHSSGPEGPAVRFAYWPKMKAQTDDKAHAKATMIRSKQYKYISRITGEDEFYDMVKDPEEKYNQIGNSEYADQIHKMQYELMKWSQKTADVVPFEYDKRFTDEMLWSKVKNNCPKAHEEEVKEKIRNGIKQGALFMYIASLNKED